MKPENDHSNKKYKIVMIGDQAVGKTSLVNILKDSQFNEQYNTTVGVSFNKYSTNVNGNKVQLQIWDTAGQEKYKALGPLYYRDSNGAIIVFDITKKDTFAHVDEWLNNYITHGKNNSIIFLVGNKSDLRDQAVISNEVAENWAYENHAKFIETSAKNNYNVDLLFNSMAESLYKENSPVLNDQALEKTANKKESCC